MILKMVYWKLNTLKRNLKFEFFWEETENIEKDVNTSTYLFGILKIFRKNKGSKIRLLQLPRLYNAYDRKSPKRL